MTEKASLIVGIELIIGETATAKADRQMVRAGTPFLLMTAQFLLNLPDESDAS